jgi:hypothetical protein
MRRTEARGGSNEEILSMTEAGDIEKAHAQLVKHRRSIIEALAKGYQAGETEIHVEALLKIQNAIDVLDTLAEDDEDDEDDE